MMFPELSRQWSGLWLPPVEQTLSEWAEKNLYLSPEYSKRSGSTVKLYAWQRGIFDAFTDKSVDSIVIMCGTQLVKTLLIQGALAYVIAEAPGPVLILEPKAEDAQAFSKERLAPMIRDCPAIASRVSVPKSRASDNTILQKHFYGGNVSLVGAMAPGNLARRSIRYLFADEIDKYPPSAGGEGDPVSLARQRLVTYGSQAKSIFACSPTIKGRSRIAREYERSDQRKPWVPCPSCGQYQVLRWSQVVWEKGIPRESQPATARYECGHCRKAWDDADRWDAVERAEWRAAKPFTGIAGFWISQLYSPWVKLSDLVKDFLEKKDNPKELQTFINTTLAELWEEEGERPDHVTIYARREDYPFGDQAVVPDRAIFLTAGVDVQEDRLEVETVAWAPDRESWSIDYSVLQVFDEQHEPLRTSNPKIWELLDRYLDRNWRHESGAELSLITMAIDVSYNATPVYKFARRHAKPAYGASGLRIIAPRTVVCVRGHDSESLVPLKSVSHTEAARKRLGLRIVTLGTGYIKQQFYDLLRAPRPKVSAGAAMPGVQHFPQYTEEHFQGLVSEKRIVNDQNGKVTWDKIFTRNEPLDCRVYATGAAIMFGLERFTEQQWEALRRTLVGKVQSTSVPTASEERQSPAPRRSLKELLRPIRSVDV